MHGHQQNCMKMHGYIIIYMSIQVQDVEYSTWWMNTFYMQSWKFISELLKYGF